ncbi:MAG: Na/Pi symporter [Cyclobacteriaceae bacterium]
MTEGRIQPPISSRPNWRMVAKNTAFIVLALLAFFFALDLLISSLQLLGNEAAENILLATSNPFTALFIGLLTAALLQSSSAVTTSVVALVASGSLPLQSAIPIIMGANVGTTITSTIVSLGFINKRKEFRRAVAAGTYHDFFNILTVVVLFPLEYYFGLLSKLSQFLAVQLFDEPLGPVTGDFRLLGGGVNPIIDFLLAEIPSGFVLVTLSIALLFGSIVFFRRVLTDILGLDQHGNVERFFFNWSLVSFLWGLVITALIRSSTVTTSLVVPLVAKKIVKLRKAVPFILGANMGTTITAFIAAVFNSNAAISIAIAHFLFNLFGVTLFSMPFLREIPIGLATRLGRLTLRYRLAGFLYLLVTFFFVPFSLIYLNKDRATVTEILYRKENLVNGRTSDYRITIRAYKNEQLNTWSIYDEAARQQLRQTVTAYRKNDLLILNNEIYEFQSVGFCREGADPQGRYRMCITAIETGLKGASGVQFDSVFVFEKRYVPQPADSVVSRVFIASRENLIVQHETLHNSRVTEREWLTEIKKP